MLPKKNKMKFGRLNEVRTQTLLLARKPACMCEDVIRESLRLWPLHAGVVDRYTRYWSTKRACQGQATARRHFASAVCQQGRTPPGDADDFHLALFYPIIHALYFVR